ncbi:MAG: response regulator [Acidimicrobiia bacterium]|nr:response regulator [Acidimicrobiia bacterium]
MQQVLVVANQTAVGPHVTQRVHELKGDAPEIGVHVVVPATPRVAKGQSAVDDAGRPIHDGDGHQRAERQLRAAIDSLERAGATNVSGSVGAPDPMQAAANAIRERRIDRIIVSTLPVGVSRWLAMDLPHRLERRFKLPVDHVIGKPTVDEVDRTPIEGPLQVLLIEDQPADVALTKQALSRADTEVEVTVAKNGAEAVEVLRTYGSGSADLVLLDLKMPVLDGHEFLEQVGREFDLESLDIAVLTTSTNEADRERAHALGAGAYIVKDPDFDVFCEMLASLVREVAAG